MKTELDYRNVYVLPQETDREQRVKFGSPYGVPTVDQLSWRQRRGVSPPPRSDGTSALADPFDDGIARSESILVTSQEPAEVQKQASVVDFASYAETHRKRSRVQKPLYDVSRPDPNSILGVDRDRAFFEQAIYEQNHLAPANVRSLAWKSSIRTAQKDKKEPVTNVIAFSENVLQVLPESPNHDPIFLDVSPDGIKALQESPVGLDDTFSPVIVFNRSDSAHDGSLGTLFRIGTNMGGVDGNGERRRYQIRIEAANVIGMQIPYSDSRYDREVYYLQPGSEMVGAFENTQGAYRKGELVKEVHVFKRDGNIRRI